VKTLSKKLGVLFALLLITHTTSLFATENTNLSTPSVSVPKVIKSNSHFVLEGKDLIDARTINKIDEMGNELYEKTGVNVYIYIKKSFLNKKPEDKGLMFKRIKEHEEKVLKDLNNSFVLISMSMDDTYINLYNSQDLDTVIDKDDILDRAIIPIIASNDKNSMETKVSVALLNGYGEIVDVVAKELKGITLDSSIESGASAFKEFWRIFMYMLVVIGLLAYMYAMMQGRKK
jgi:hypothetical protein